MWIREAAATGRVVLMSDLHGRADALAAFSDVAELSSTGDWNGTTLVCAGDVIDRGPRLTVRQLRSLRVRQRAEARIQALLQGGRRASADYVHRILRPPTRWSESRRHRAMVDLAGALGALDCLASLRAMADLAGREGGEVSCLRGNHEQDLLRGTFRWMTWQKATLLILAGADPGRVHDLMDAPPTERLHLMPGLLHEAPLLQWIETWPVILVAGDLAVVHGGPTREFVTAMRVRGIRDRGALEDWFAASARPDHPLWAEGRGILSPDSYDFLTRAPWLVDELLGVLDAQLLAVGHSPFLRFAGRGWVDSSDPSVREITRRQELIGPRLLKLDGDLKRQERGGGVVEIRGRAIRAAGWEPGWRDLGRVPSKSSASLDEPGRPEAPAQPHESDGETRDVATARIIGWDARAMGRIWRLMDQISDPALQERLQGLLGRILALGIPDLGTFEEVLQEGGRGAEFLEGLVSEAEARAREIAAKLAAQADTREVVFHLPPNSTEVRGLVCNLEQAVLEELSGSGLRGVAVRPGPGHEVEVLSLGPRGLEVGRPPGWAMPPAPPEDPEDLCRVVARRMAGEDVVSSGSAPGRGPREQAGLRAARDEDLPEPDEPADAFPMDRSGVPPGILAGAELLIRHAAGPLSRGYLGAGPSPTLEAMARLPDRDGHYRGLYRVRLGAADADLVMAHLPGHEVLMVVNAPFVTLTEPLPVVHLTEPPRVGEHGSSFLLSRLTQDPVVLYNRSSPEVLGVLRRGGRLGRGVDEARAPWDTRPYLFTTPLREVADLFTGEPTTFSVPRADLEDMVRGGLVRLGLMHLVRGRYPALWGSIDLALEVIAMGEDGVHALWAFAKAP